MGSVLVMFFGGVRVGHVFWWSPCWSCFLVGFVLVMFFSGVRVGHVFWWVRVGHVFWWGS